MLAAGCGGVADGDPVAEMPGAVHRFTEVEDRSWHWVEAGAGPPLVLLHGMPQDWYAWRHQIEALAVDHRVLAPDLPGFGLSDRGEGEHSPAAVAERLVAWMAVLELDGVALVGHDWGGLVGAWAAAHEARRVERYAHVCSPLEVFDLGRLPDYRDFHGSPETAVRVMESADFFVTRLMDLAVYGGADAYSQEALDRYARQLRRRGTARAVARYFRDLELGPGDRLGDGARPPWERLHLPVLLVTADRDLVQPLERYLDAEELIPGLWRSVIVDDAGHFPHEERPEAVTRILRDFLEAP